MRELNKFTAFQAKGLNNELTIRRLAYTSNKDAVMFLLDDY